PDLESDVPAHRETAHDRAVEPGSVERLEASPCGELHRHHAVLGGTASPEARELWRDPPRAAPLGSPHRRVPREGMDQQQPRRHRPAFAFGPPITGSAPGRPSKSAGAGPTRSPSAYTMTLRSASTLTRVARAIRTAGCVTCVPRKTRGKARTNAPLL